MEGDKELEAVAEEEVEVAVDEVGEVALVIGVKVPKIPSPRKDEPRKKTFDGTTLHWCGRCGEWLHKDHTCKQPATNNSDEANIASTYTGATAFHTERSIRTIMSIVRTMILHVTVH